MRFKAKVLILLIVLSVFLVGCKEEQPALSNPFIGGTKGVIAEFEEIGLVSDTQNVNEVYENEDFAIELRLKNKGEYEVPANSVIINMQGINPEDFGIVAQKTNDEKIERVTDFNKDGGEVTVDFGDASYSVTGNFFDATFFAVYSYPYETLIAIPKVCYKVDIREKRVCDIDESKDIFSTGAPIVATKAVESPASTRKIRLTLDIENVAGGRASTTRDFDSRYDEVNFEVLTEGWTCKSKNESVARLIDGKAQIRCTLDNELDENDLFEKQFELRLKYYYEDIAKVDVRILDTDQI